jgi:hypothetical protein
LVGPTWRSWLRRHPHLRWPCADARSCGGVCHLGAFVRWGEELRDRTPPCLGRDRRDGKPDLVTANYVEDGAVSVLLNRGDGSFRAKRDFRTGGGPFSVAIGDLNGDGKLDLATANGYGPSTVSVLLNRGDGSFQPKVDYATGSAYSVAIGDLNGDGKPDLATGNISAGTVSVLLNRGDGSFQAKLDYETGESPSSVAIGDLNGDRRPDLVTANPGEGTSNRGKNKSVSVLLNTPGLCTVQDVRGKTVSVAKRTIVPANCRVGKIRRVYSPVCVIPAGVSSQKPTFGAVLRGGGKVNLVVFSGRKG